MHIQFIITSESLSYITSFMICRYLCGYCNVKVWTLVFLSTSSIWGCPFCRTKGQGGRLGKRLVNPNWLLQLFSFYAGVRIVVVFIVLEVVTCSHCCSILFSRWWWSWEEEQSSGLQWFFNWRRKYREHAFSWNGIERACFLEGSLLINYSTCLIKKKSGSILKFNTKSEMH